MCLFYLHIDASVGKHHTEEIQEDIHGRNTFLFPGITFEKQLADVKSLHKFCGRIGNIVSIICYLWYT